MTFDAIAISALLGLSTLIGVQSVPTQKKEIWQITENWKITQINQTKIITLKAESKEIVSQCARTPNYFINFPPIIHGAHEVFLDGKKIYTFGDPSFQSPSSFYGAPHMSCSDVQAGTILTWKASCYSEYFSRFSFFPLITSKRPISNFFNEGLNMLAAGGLAIMAFFCWIIFWGRVSNGLALSIGFSSLFFSIYFLGATAGLVGIYAPMLTLHKIADTSLWIAGALFFNALRIYGIISKNLFFIYLINVSLAVLLICLSSSGDSVQFGTTLPFLLTGALNFYSTGVLSLVMFKNKFELGSILPFLSLLVFSVAYINEIFVVTGLLQSYTVSGIGCAGGLLFFALYVNERITQTYRERDYLQSNLQLEVDRKTEELNQKSHDLESALSNLKGTQADLVQSARLASLGTLSAGIAHEINNSLNYVYGALKPLEKLVNGGVGDDLKPKIKPLFTVMHEGLRLTFEIIKNLKNFTGLNQAKFKDIFLHEVFQTVMTILKSRLKNNIQITYSVPNDLIVYGSTVGLNQVFINLISNAVDSMNEVGSLSISGQLEGNKAIIQISDSGGGIPLEIQDRIFDPFFTTKEVGKGTGLGLYIVKMEIDKLHGKIKLDSSADKGTTFTIELPLTQIKELGEAA